MSTALRREGMGGKPLLHHVGNPHALAYFVVHTKVRLIMDEPPTMACRLGSRTYVL